MKPLQLSEEMARELYPSSPLVFQKILEANFTKEQLTQDPEELYYSALKLLRKEAKDMKGDWIADWNNPKQKKWRAIFVWEGSGFVFSHADYGDSSTGASCGSRFYFATPELAEKHARDFIKEHNIVLCNQ